ncbi:MAG: GlxA family transcriptional regulator [Granulosicoccus sp.]
MPVSLRVQFLIQPHFSLLAFTAAADALTTANLVQKEKRFAFDTIGLTDAPVISDLGIRVNADRSINEVRLTNTDILIVCGGYRCAITENRKISRFLIEADQANIQLGGLWNGCIAIAHAGLMNGFACALHPNNQDFANEHFPQMTLRPDALIVDRTRLSAAGPNSSFDLMLILIRRFASSDTTSAIRNILRADISQPPGQASDDIDNLPHQLPDKLQRAVQLMRNHLGEPLPRDDIAIHIGMSTRAMERLFQRSLQVSPARHYLELRLVRAHEMLRQSEEPIGRIADNCGFVSSAHFSRAFSKRFGCSPKSLRQSASRLIG